MVNKDFKQDWKSSSGEVNVIVTEHFSVDIDKDFIGFAFSFSLTYKILYIQILNLIFRTY